MRFTALLKKMTGLPIEEFTVTSLEIGANMNMEKPFQIYGHSFDYVPRFSRSRKYSNAGTEYFHNKSKKLILYDKGKEFKENQKSKGIIPFDINLDTLFPDSKLA